jgi:hypothetical protein
MGAGSKVRSPTLQVILDACVADLETRTSQHATAAYVAPSGITGRAP